MPRLQQQFESYQQFANSTINEVLGLSQNEETDVFQTTTFQSGIFVNQNNQFQFKALPNMAQMAPMLASIITDVNHDKKPDFITFGNIYNTEPETPSLDALSSKLFVNKGNNTFDFVSLRQSGLNIMGNLKDAKQIKINKENLIIVSLNNSKLVIFLENN